MSWRSRLGSGLASLFRRRRLERDIDDELQGYLDAAVEDKVRTGISLEQARREAQMVHGSPASVKDGMRDAGWESTLDAVRQDVRYAARSLRASPAFTAAAILTLALGIGANAAIFSLVNGLLFRPVPVPNLDRLVAVARAPAAAPARPGIGRFSVTAEERRAIATSTNSPVDALVMSDPLLGALSAAGQVEMVAGELVSGNYFDVFGLRPRAGRLLVPSDDDTTAGAAIVISERLWRQWFGGDPAAMGTTARMAGFPLTIVGVAPDSFKGTWLPTMMTADFWVPVSARDRLRTVQGSSRPEGDPHRTFARLGPGATVAQADAAFSTIGHYPAYPNEPPQRLTALPAERGILFDDFARPGLLIGTAVTALASLVFLIACANLVNLLLARGARRQAEMAIRLAMGASRRRVFRTVLTEVLVLTAMAGVAGLLVTFVVTTLMTWVPLPQLAGISIRFDPSPDWRVFGFGFAIALLAALATGLLPAWQATRTDPVRVLTAGGFQGATSRRGRRLRTSLVAAQVAMSVVLVLLAGLYVRSALTGTQIDIGYIASGAAMASIDMRLHGIDDASGRARLDRLRSAAQAIPGVQRAALASGLPGTVSQSTGQLTLEGESLVDNGRGRVARYLAVSPGFFEALRLPLRTGRDFSDTDTEAAVPVAIVSESAAAAFWPGQDPLGRRFSLRAGDPVREVIGVVANAGSRPSSALDLPFVYLPVRQEYAPRVSVIVRGAPSAEALLEPLRRALRAVDPELAVFDVRTVEQTVGMALLPIRGAALVLGMLGLLAFGIAMLGVYGVLAYVVSQRTREFGIRKALGATNAGLYGLVIGAGFRMLILGAIPGVLLAFLAARLLGRLLYGIAPHDPIAFTLVPAVLLMVGLCACAVAARRAARIDPTVALRDL